MISLATEADRTLYFDFLPINIGNINGFAAKFQLYTVPGQVYYNATRKLVLRGVDGVVFVADSQPDKMDENIESLLNLQDNLKEYGYDINELPIVIQYNKCDLPGVLSADEMNAKLNQDGKPFYVASATVGNGVFDTLKMVIKLVLDKAKNSASGKMNRSTPVEKVQPTPSETPQENSVEQSQPNYDTPVVRERQSDVPPSQQPDYQPTPKPDMMPEETNVLQQEPVGVVSSDTARIEQRINYKPQYRPYPGSENPKSAQEPIEEDIDTSEESNSFTDDKVSPIVGKSPVVDLSQEHIKNAPVMSPSLKKKEIKKRSLIKRIFGRK
jgi:signal recognition particle receptor subunit beta